MTHGLLSAIDKREREERDRLESLNRRYNKAMADLGLADPEYVDNPERCGRRIRAMREEALDRASKLIAERIAEALALEITQRNAIRLVWCEECGSIVTSTAPQTRFCSDQCRWRHDKRMSRARNSAKEGFPEAIAALQEFVDRYPGNVGAAQANLALARLKGEK